MTPKANPTAHPKYRIELFTVYLLGVSLARRRFAARRRTPSSGRSVRSDGESSLAMTQTKFTIAALVVGFTFAALIVLSAITMGAVAGT